LPGERNFIRFGKLPKLLLLEYLIVAKSKRKKKKHVPQRTCVGCRTVQSKRSLIRVVCGPEGIQVDPTGKLAGRGAYLHSQRSCWELGLKGSLAHALKHDLTAEENERLLAFMASLPDDETVES
jgi:predicted RNA-binding protein YlxR (DUF448 family)